MFSRLILGIKNFSKLSSIFDHIDYVNNRHISKLLDFFIIRRIDVRFCNNVIHYLSSNVQYLGLNEINSLLKNVLFTNYTLNSSVLNDILSILIEKYRFDQILSLDIFYHLLLLDSSCCISSNKCVEFLHNFRLSSDCVEQLYLLNVFSVIQFFRTDIISFYTPQLTNYVKYLKLLSPKILLRSGLYGETDDIIQVKKIMDKLNVEYVSGITGHLYNPIILKGTNMAIDVDYERDIYYESHGFERISSLKQFIMNEMGWKLRFIPIDEWKYNISDEDKRNYLGRFICKYYVDTQFDKNPPWAPI